jgi:hypothetical protein
MAINMLEKSALHTSNSSEENCAHGYFAFLSLFFTLNPADTYNPLSAFTAGSDINIDTIFDNPDSRFTSFERARLLAANPIAGAEFFKSMVDQFILGRA